MSDLRISVVIPTVGRREALGRCLDALVDGTLPPMELIVVDQSAGEEIARLLEAKREAFPALRRLAEQRRGLAAARNAGAHAASGDVVAFTDDDCVPDSGWIAALDAAFAEVRLSAVTGPMLPLGPESIETAAVSSRTSTTRREFMGRALPWVVGTGGNTAVRRESFLSLGGYDERLGVGSPADAGEDLDLFRRLLGAGGPILYDPLALCRHERKTPSERRERRASYGRGAGAALGRWLRDGDPWALVALVRWVTLRARLALTAREEPTSSLLDEIRVLRGTIGGFLHGVALPAWAPDARDV